ncbi:MAG: COG4280 domain-containing protein [Acidimicrobiales bacterium]
MSSATIAIALAVFAASAVETVEAVTIVIAAGVTRGWRSAFEGAAAALVVLAAIVAVLGPLVVKAPLGGLRIVIGTILLIYGMQWLRKAVLRAAGVIPKHDEDAIYQREVARLELPGARPARDGIGFAVAFKGVLLEGFEIVVIVVTLGTTDHELGLSALSALAAILIVSGVGAALSRQLSEVPENALKMFVGILLVSFGSYWSGEGLGVHWPGSDLAILVLVAVFGVTAALLTALATRMNRQLVKSDAAR